MYSEIDINLIWSIVKDIVIPNVGILIFNTITYSLLGVIFAIIILFIASKKKVLKRIPKYYNWGVKLYIPFLIIGFLYLFGQIGFVKGVEKVLNNEKDEIVNGIYEESVYLTFETEDSKNQFFNELKASTESIRFVSDSIPKYIDKVFVQNDSETTSSNTIFTKLYTRYRTEIYSAVGYAMFNVAAAAASKGHISFFEEMSYAEFNVAMDVAKFVSSEELEEVIKRQLADWYIQTVSFFVSGFLKTLYILILVVVITPLIEFLIYKKWIESKFQKKVVDELK